MKTFNLINSELNQSCQRNHQNEQVRAITKAIRFITKPNQSKISPNQTIQRYHQTKSNQARFITKPNHKELSPNQTSKTYCDTKTVKSKKSMNKSDLSPNQTHYSYKPTCSSSQSVRKSRESQEGSTCSQNNLDKQESLLCVTFFLHLTKMAALHFVHLQLYCRLRTEDNTRGLKVCIDYGRKTRGGPTNLMDMAARQRRCRMEQTERT